MKCSVALAVLILCACSTEIAAQSAAVGLYNEANRLYRQGQFAAARDKYLQSIAGGLADGRCYYNLGNACFKAGFLGQAILWYERALRLDPRDPDALANLRFANLVKKDRDARPAGNVVWRFLASAYHYPTLNQLCLFFSFLLAAVFALATWRLWHPSPSLSVWLGALLICAAGTVAASLLLGMRIHQEEKRELAIVTAVEGVARSAPDAQKTTVFIIHEGTKVQIERREGDWFLVRLANGLGGWLPVEALERI